MSGINLRPWDPIYDKRRANKCDLLTEPRLEHISVRIDMLAKAGALIAAEIDRLGRL